MAWVVIILVGLALVLTPTTVFGYVRGKSSEFSVGGIGGAFVLRADAASRFNDMRSAALLDGVVLKVDSAFRTMAEQESLYKAYQEGTGNMAAVPGRSNHQSGIAVDITVHRSFTSTEYAWLDTNAKSYGFVNTGKGFSNPEPWHWEYLNG